MNKILFVDKIQFGNLTDTLKYCEYLNNRYIITYLCFDRNRPKAVVKNVNVVYVPYLNNRFFRQLLFLLYFFKTAFFFDGFIFVIFHSRCLYLKKMMPWKKMHLDIRTLSVLPDKNIREKQNRELVRTIKAYDTISAISTGIIEIINKHINRDIFYLPLGADTISTKQKCFNSLKLLYVGTLNNRRIIDTVKAVHKIVQQDTSCDIHYDIVGDGEEMSELAKYIEDNELSKYIKIWGRIRHQDLSPLFDKCNIGVSYIPIEDYYQFQPPTKTYEYIFSGLYVIATKTFENAKIVSHENGVLIDDNVESFVNALYFIDEIKSTINSNSIRESLKMYSWARIIEDHFIPIIEKL